MKTISIFKIEKENLSLYKWFKSNPKKNQKLLYPNWRVGVPTVFFNNEFINKFSIEQQKKILETRIKNNDHVFFGAEGGSDTIDKIFLLSINEANKYFDNDIDRIALFNNKQDDWMLRCPCVNRYISTWIHSNGFIDVYKGDSMRLEADGYDIGIRPALWLKL